MLKRLFYLFAAVASLTLAACSEKDAKTVGAAPEAAPAAKAVQKVAATGPRHKFEVVMRGARLYAENCASCHGRLAQGHPNWQKPDAEGKYPPPPLNGTGHTWHHTQSVLKRVIKGGTAAMGGNMPAWGEKLSDEEIEAIIAWIQSHWPDELYATWLEMDTKSRARP